MKSIEEFDAGLVVVERKVRSAAVTTLDEKRVGAIESSVCLLMCTEVARQVYWLATANGFTSASDKELSEENRAELLGEIIESE